jgi:hypothetical protein
MADMPKPKKPNKILIATALIIIIVAVAVVSVTAYYSLPSQTPKPDVVTNFHEGAWANYSFSNYNSDGAVAHFGSMLASTARGTYDGKDCWIYVENVSIANPDGSAANDVFTYYLDTDTYTTLHQTETTTADGVVVYDAAFNPGDADFMDRIANLRNMTITATDKSVTVPAGTFSTTQREGPVTYANRATTFDVTTWASPDVPTWGTVKTQFYLNGSLCDEYLLTNYGS